MCKTQVCATDRMAVMTDQQHAQVVAKLVVSDADKAIAYYKSVLGAVRRQRYTHRGEVVFAEIELQGTRLELKTEDQHDPSPSTLGHPGVLLSVTTEDPDGLAAAMVGGGGEMVFEVADQPYGARGGRVRDPFGHEWLLQTPLSMTPEEVQSAMNEMG